MCRGREARDPFLVKRVYPILLAAVALIAVASPGVAAARSPKGVQHLHFRFGPLNIRPGSNLILIGQATPAEKPSEVFARAPERPRRPVGNLALDGAAGTRSRGSLPVRWGADQVDLVGPPLELDPVTVIVRLYCPLSANT